MLSSFMIFNMDLQVGSTVMVCYQFTTLEILSVQLSYRLVISVKYMWKTFVIT